MKRQWQKLMWFALAFAACYWLPVGQLRFDNAVSEALHLTRWYAREHVLLCLVPAFLIAGAIGVFISQGPVMKYLGPKANRLVSYGVASVSGTVLAVCSCTVLPLFAGIRSMGAGLGPATTFLYAGPAINVLAIIFTARVLGLELGIARAVGAVVFSVVIGLLMAVIFRKEEATNAKVIPQMPQPEVARPLWQTTIYFAAMIGVLVFANWSKPDQTSGLWDAVYSVKWPLTVFCAAIVGLLALTSFSRSELSEWFDASWGFARQILPLLLLGVLAAGLLLGRPGHEGLIPSRWIEQLVGGNSVRANLFASIVGALMYFATLTEVPILRGLIDAGMGKGPALALLLAGPAVSLPNLLVIRSIMGLKKTLVFALLVIVMATVTGVIYGALPI